MDSEKSSVSSEDFPQKEEGREPRGFCARVKFPKVAEWRQWQCHCCGRKWQLVDFKFCDVCTKLIFEKAAMVQHNNRSILAYSAV